MQFTSKSALKGFQKCSQTRQPRHRTKPTFGETRIDETALSPSPLMVASTDAELRYDKASTALMI